jgi:hypothetical protein
LRLKMALAGDSPLELGAASAAVCSLRTRE